RRSIGGGSMQELSNGQPACPVCGATQTMPVLHRRSVPVHQNLLYDSPDDARAIARGDLELWACIGCQFVFNAAFVPDLLSYAAAYENSQDASPAFSDHLEGLVERLASRREVVGREVVEVGCGKGMFLRRLLTRPGVEARAIGFDPAYVGPETELAG